MKSPGTVASRTPNNNIPIEHNGNPPDPQLQCALQNALARLRRWPPPASWSRSEWGRELEQRAVAAALSAAARYDPADGIALGSFIYMRVMSDVRTLYRRERKWGWRRQPEALLQSDWEDEDDAVQPTALVEELLRAAAAARLRRDLRDAVAALPPAWRRLVVRHFFKGRCQAALAAPLAMSQSHISRQLAAALKHLRALLQR